MSGSRITPSKKSSGEESAPLSSSGAEARIFSASVRPRPCRAPYIGRGYAALHILLWQAFATGGFGLAWKNGSATSAKLTRTSISSVRSRIRPRRKSSGDTLGSANWRTWRRLLTPSSYSVCHTCDHRVARRVWILAALLSLCWFSANRLLLCYFMDFLVEVGYREANPFATQILPTRSPLRES